MSATKMLLAATLAAVPWTLVLAGCDFDILDDDSADEDWPDYEGEIDIAGLDAMIECNADGGSPETGSWTFTVFFDGWSDWMWVEIWGDPYCEGYDPATGDWCDTTGNGRPGWDMVEYDRGWDEELGFWDEWDLELPFDSTIWTPADGVSYFSCAMAPDIEIYFCGCDEATTLCDCTAPFYP